MVSAGNDVMVIAFPVTQYVEVVNTKFDELAGTV